MPDDDRSTYEEGVRRGGYLLTVCVPEGLEAQAEDVMEQADPIDIDQRSKSWRQEGWSGGSYAGAAGSGAGAWPTTGRPAPWRPAVPHDTLGDKVVATDTATTGVATGTSAYAGTGGSTTSSGLTGDTDETDETLQVVEEDLHVGKREVAGGRVRVRTYMTERPVEEDVNLRSERVTIERRPVDREVTPGAAAFQERTIEAVERGEEAVVAKTARVKEEIAIHKDVENRTETVRSTEVEVDDDRTGLTGSDPSLRSGRNKI